MLSDSNNFWCEYSWHNLPSNDCLAFHLTQCLLLHCQGNADQVKYALKYAKNVKNVPNIIDYNLKKHHQILVIFGLNISDTTGYWMII